MSSIYCPGRSLAGCVALFVLATAGSARGQILLAEDDQFSVPSGEALVVEAFGVLDNDTLDDENAGESGATAALVSDVSHGTLALGSNGSFTYSPDASFDGTDSFVYRAVFEAVSDEATVTLTACSGGPQVFTCWKQAAFLAKADALGHPSFSEGFEDDAVWGAARSPNTILSVSSRGIEWRANDFDPTHSVPPLPPPPPPNEITTDPGPALTGLWAVFDLEHGYATGTPVQCDVDNPPEHCLYHDGFTIRPEKSSAPLFGAGGFFTGSFGANVAFVLDGDWPNPIAGGKLVGGGHRFFGVIDAGPAGFAEIQFRETDGKVGQSLFIFGDDFTILTEPAVPVPGLGLPTVVGLVLVLVSAGVWYLRRSRATDPVAL